MSEIASASSQSSIQQKTGQFRQQPSFLYQMVDIKARKIVTLIKFSKLPYILEQITQPQARPYQLKTSQGDLHDEYQIIGYIVNDSFVRNLKITDKNDCDDDRQVLCSSDIFIWAKMNQHLFDLRKNLFPLLQQFYKYLLGHDKVKKSKYQSLNSKIRKQILKIDQNMSDHSQIYAYQHSFLIIIIVCELFLALRKSKSKFFNKCEKICKDPIFEQTFGKASFCIRQCTPVQFQQQEQPEIKKQQMMHMQMAKISQPWISQINNEKRNQLCYNFFKNLFKSDQSKVSYFPYYWLMYQHLLCNLIQIHYQSTQHGQTLSDLQKIIASASQDLSKIVKQNIDYGFLGIYVNQKDKLLKLQGLLCLTQLTIQDLDQQIKRHSNLKKFKVLKDRKKVQMLWQYKEGMTFQGIKVSTLRQI